MKTPEVHCLHRAELLAEELTNRGYAVEILEIESPSIIGFLKFGKDNRDYFYDYGGINSVFLDSAGVHYAVSIKNEKGEVIVLDPQFSDSPLKIDEYTIAITGQKPHTRKEKNLFKTKVEWYPPTTVSTVQKFGTVGFAFRNLCGWHNSESSRLEIESINANFSFTTGRQLPNNEKPSTELRRKLRKEKLEEIESMLKDKISKIKEDLVKINSGILPFNSFDSEDDDSEDEETIEETRKALDVLKANRIKEYKRESLSKLARIEKLLKNLQQVQREVK